MDDLLLCLHGEHFGDLALTEDGDFMIGENVLQNARTAIGWIEGEWRLGPELGVPWFEDIWIKNPNLDLIKSELASTAREVDGIADAKVDVEEYDPRERTIKMHLTCIKEDGTINSGEVDVSA